MGTSRQHGRKAEQAIEDALQSLRDALKQTERADYVAGLNYVVSGAMQAVGLAEQELRLARDAETLEKG